MIQYQDAHALVFESDLFRTTSAVIQTPDLVLVVDPTWLPREIEEIAKTISVLANQRPVYQLFTHSDYDHIMGYGAFPEAKVIASQKLAHETDRVEAVEKVLEWDESYYIKRPYPIRYPQVDIAANSGEKLTIGETILSFEASPGHNSDGLITVVDHPALTEGPILIAGDYLSNEEFPFIYHSVKDYLHTLEKLEQVLSTNKPSILVPGHGDVTRDPQEMRSRWDASKAYIDQLTASVLSETEFDESDLWKRYPYKRGIRSFHLANLKLASKELS